ncbi:2'-5' RNA ligase [Candidatus Uhrbacteria bacterium RIFCSPLOWO2_02_FULL_48_12]|uniref:RNA 2',3'-cyclic phosphodiesterase n=1 Tax=Candidatus Uhrbacteria bacterium RIFCSPLOWO2_02_FULL_48_12 TaxID=1802407 RepID=A0A1F7V9X6_9BACT|nr:MAG: 2'-5' RNA ligase [Candidatus Uhrbacteria bacterium RIFCSPLOWO2_02_FULL_48_12]
MQRLFIAVPSPITIQELISEIEHEWEKLTSHNVKWVNPEQAHLTLHFLGNTEEGTVPEIIKIIKESTIKVRPFLLVLKGLGAFPQPSNARVVYINVEEIKSRVLNTLHKNLANQLKSLGFAIDDRRFMPHITLGRLRQARALTTEWYVTRPISWSVNEIHLVESKLLAVGPIHTVVESVRLN